MQNLKIWIFSLIVAALICSVTDFFLPVNKQKIFRIILNIFLVLCILSPLKKIKFNEIVPNLNTSEKFKTQTNLKIEKIVKANVKRLIEKKIGDKAKILDICIDENDDQTVICKMLLLSEQENAEKIRKKIEDEFKVKVRFENRVENTRT
ncbi:MAG: hypothetical protein LBK29_02755 [Oscillospiraceae bacterium]|jgi:hypothetical protein|nr:hypothetical protein [Oscillospiraceae bacterium]